MCCLGGLWPARGDADAWNHGPAGPRREVGEQAARWACGREAVGTGRSGRHAGREVPHGP